jgi:hypothetical protein
VSVGDNHPVSVPDINALSGHYRGARAVHDAAGPADRAGRDPPLAVYLASDDARMMTGQAVNLDGGICMA